MRHLLAASVALALSTSAVASGTFIEINTPDVQLTQVSPNGAYAAGTSFNTAGFRWTAADNQQELLPALNSAFGINNLGVIAGSVAENGGAYDGGRDLGAWAAIGAAPVLLSDPLTTNSSGYGIADDGTVVGLSFEDQYAGNAVAFVWTAAEGMLALPVPRPANYSRANAISADGRVIVGWNDQDDGSRTGMVWLDRTPFDIVDADGYAVGEASAVTPDGSYVVGSGYMDADFNEGSWRWSADGGVELIPGMSFAFGVSGDGRMVVGNTGFFDNPPRTPMVWREGIGTVSLADFLAEQGIEIPAGWDVGGGLGGLSADGHTLAGWGFGPLGMQSYIVQIDAGEDGDVIFASGFDEP